MLGNIIRLWLVTPDKVASFGHNCAGTRVGFQLKYGAEWVEIPLLRDTAGTSGSISDISNSDFKFTAVSMLISMKMLGQRYVCKYMTNTGATFVVGNGRAFVLNGGYTTGKQPGDVAGTTLILQGASHYPDQWLVEIPAEKPVDPPEPPVVNPTLEHFDTLDNVKVYSMDGLVGDINFIELQLGQEVNGASFSKPSASVIRLKIASHGGYIIVARWFPSAKNIRDIDLKITEVSTETPWCLSSQGPIQPGDVFARTKALTTPGNPWNGTGGDKFIPAVGRIFDTYYSNDDRYYGFCVELTKSASEGVHYFDLDYMQWTFA